jgi:hypothetical protein
MNSRSNILILLLIVCIQESEIFDKKGKYSITLLFKIIYFRGFAPLESEEGEIIVAARESEEGRMGKRGNIDRVEREREREGGRERNVYRTHSPTQDGVIV